ncbi:hypothetical protein [Hafnia paralvei]|uniref:hypothetical protein n=1 Tax=Hafnia paralvei TaxID=546367 RepID=UPI00241DB7BA|nr:hypothetical protein [Hafnia paralvei]
MTKLTTESLEKFVNDIKTDGMCDITDYQVALALRQLLAYEQAANEVACWGVTGQRGQIYPLSPQTARMDSFPLYRAPVLPKQPELVDLSQQVEILNRILNWMLKELPVPTQKASAMAIRLSSVIDIISDLEIPAPAQPVIPEQANILGYFSFDPEDGAEILKDRQTAIDNCNASIDLYRESMQEEYPDGWSDDVKRVCWGVILQEARGFDAQGIPENDPNHTYQTLDYRLYPDSTNTVTAQPVSNPYKLKDAVEDIRNSGVEIDTDKIKAERDALNSPVIPDGWKLVPVNATRAMIDAAARVEEDGYDAMHKAMLAAAPARESE